MNQLVFERMSPWCSSNEALQHLELFNAARRVAAAKEHVSCHIYPGTHYVSLDHAVVRVPYHLSLTENDEVGTNFRIQVSSHYTCGVGSMIDICYLEPGAEQDPLYDRWWPSHTGWSLHLSGANADSLVEDGIKASEMVRSFLEQVFPGQTFGNGEHNLNPLLLEGSSPDDPASARHPNAIKMIERVVDWFVDLHKLVVH